MGGGGVRRIITKGLYFNACEKIQIFIYIFFSFYFILKYLSVANANLHLCNKLVMLVVVSPVGTIGNLSGVGCRVSIVGCRVSVDDCRLSVSFIVVAS